MRDARRRGGNLMDGLKKWLFRTFVGDALLKTAYAKLDAYATKRWPRGWPRVQFAMRGWVTKLGVLMAGVAGATLWVMDRMSPEDAVRLALWVGIGLTAVGLARKGVKWFVYFEATDKDGWLDDPKAKKPEGLSESEKALVAGKLADAKVDLKEAAASVDKASKAVKPKR